jgi:hypothetical protein
MLISELNSILNTARLSPSIDNVQPWNIEILSPSKFIISLNKSITLQYDIENYGSYISCGAFIKSCEIAAMRKGYSMQISFDVDKSNSDIATISFKKSQKKSKLNDHLFTAIKKRYTPRVPMQKKALSNDFYEDMNLVNKFQYNVNFYEEGTPKLEKIRNDLYKADKIRFGNHFFHKVFFPFVYFSKKPNHNTGISYKELGIPFFEYLMGKVICNWKIVYILKKLGFINMFTYFSAKRLFQKSQGVLIISSNKTMDRGNCIRLGMMFNEIWLLLTHHGFSLQPYGAMPFISRLLKKGAEGKFSKQEEEVFFQVKKSLYETLKLSKDEECLLIMRFGVPKKEREFPFIRKTLKEITK